MVVRYKLSMNVALGDVAELQALSMRLAADLNAMGTAEPTTA